MKKLFLIMTKSTDDAIIMSCCRENVSFSTEPSELRDTIRLVLGKQ